MSSSRYDVMDRRNMSRMSSGNHECGGPSSIQSCLRATFRVFYMWAPILIAASLNRGSVSGVPAVSGTYPGIKSVVNCASFHPCQPEGICFSSRHDPTRVAYASYLAPHDREAGKGQRPLPEAWHRSLYTVRANFKIIKCLERVSE